MKSPLTKPLVLPAPSTRAYGRCLARLLATARKRKKDDAR